jgi:hypothetical protein
MHDVNFTIEWFDASPLRILAGGEEKIVILSETGIFELPSRRMI